jgi:hypothetical protein
MKVADTSDAIEVANSEYSLFDRNCEKLDRALLLSRTEKMMTPKDYAWLDGHVRRFRKELKTYKARCCAKSISSEKGRQFRLLKSFSARVASVACVIIADGQYEGIERHGLTQKKLTQLAEQLDVFARLSGFARLGIKLKDNGSKRATLNFSGNVRSAQFLVGSILAAQDIEDSNNYARPGKNLRGAIQQVEEEVLDGFNHWLSLDFEHNFPSLKRRHLSWLKLPKRVIANVLFPNEYIDIKGNKSECTNMAIRQGLPQGAAVSGQIASALIRWKLEKIVSSKYRRVSYVDDVVIGARSQDQIKMLAKAIKGSFENDPAGSLNFSKFDFSHSTEGIDFAGHRIHRSDHPIDDGQYTVWKRPNPKSYRRYERRLRQKVIGITDPDACMAIADIYAANWIKAFGIEDEFLIEELRATSSVIALD